MICPRNDHFVTQLSWSTDPVPPFRILSSIHEMDGSNIKAEKPLTAAEETHRETIACSVTGETLHIN